MRHRIAHRKLGRVTEHRISMLRNQASALIEHERIETTVARAKELQPFVERIITVAKRSLKAADGSMHGVTARRNCSTRSPRASATARVDTRGSFVLAIAAATMPKWRRSS